MGLAQLVQLIAQGEPVSPGVANRPLRTLDQNTQSLWNLVQAAALGATVSIAAVTVEAEAAVGMPVYWNDSTQRFERCLAALDVTGGTLTTAASAQVWGVVSNKASATLANLLLFGYAALDISAAVNGTPTPGLYYLSGVTPGMLVQQRPPVSIGVLRYDGTHVFVNPQLVDFVDRHVHYRVDLVCRPAGDTSPPAFGEAHTITDASVSLPGWLPASDSSFDGLAPRNAVFGYNLKADPTLASLWPPLPPENAAVVWDKGLNKDEGFTGVPDSLLRIDSNGLWWLSDCYADVPWPVSLETGSVSASTSASTSVSIPADVCPRTLTMRMRLYMTQPQVGPAALVTSLRTTDPRLFVSKLDNSAGNTGDIKITLNNVVERLYALSSNVMLYGKGVVEGDTTYYQGDIGITVQPPTSYELPVDVLSYSGSVDTLYQGVGYLVLPAGMSTSYRAKLDVPGDLPLLTPQLSLRFRLLGTLAGTLPTLTLTARRVVRPAHGLTTPVALPLTGAEFSVALSTTSVLTAAYQYVEAVSAAFTVVAGDSVYFTLTRASDSYSGAVGVLQQSGVVSAG